MKRLLPLLSFVLIGLSSGLALAQVSQDDWASWRGPNANGIAKPGQNPPVRFSDQENVIWKVPVPGRGHSSPTLVGERIFLSTADEQKQIQSVLAFARGDGRPLWKTDLNQGGFPKTHPKNTHATPTVACDGERVFATFHHHNKITLHTLDLNGKILWEKTVGPYHPRRFEYGYAPSPLLYEDLVIIAADVEQGGYLVAYARENGERVWKTNRPRMYSFSSPIVANVAGEDQLLISGCNGVASYNPETGNINWAVQGTTMATCGTMVWDGDLVFASGGYPKKETICVKADGTKQVMWKNKQKCYEQSMLATGGYVFAVDDNGVAHCWRARDGQEMWKERLSGPVSTSPILVGDRIYATNERGTTYVFKADPERFELLAENQLGTESFATPAFCENRIYARVAQGNGRSRQEYLYCLGKK